MSHDDIGDKELNFVGYLNACRGSGRRQPYYNGRRR